MKRAYGVFKSYGDEPAVVVLEMTEIEGELEGSTEWVTMCSRISDLTDVRETLDEARAIADIVSLELAIPRRADLDDEARIGLKHMGKVKKSGRPSDSSVSGSDRDELRDKMSELGDGLPENIQRSFGADCAAHVLYLFEAKNPGDYRPRKAIAVARAYINGQATQRDLYKAYQDAEKSIRGTGADQAAALSAAYAAFYPVQGITKGYSDERDTDVYRATAVADCAALAAAKSNPSEGLFDKERHLRERQWQLARLKSYLDGSASSVGSQKSQIKLTLPSMYRPTSVGAQGGNKKSGRVSQFTPEQVTQALRQSNGRVRGAAQVLGTSHQNLSQLIKAWGISWTEYRTVPKMTREARRPSLLTKKDVENALDAGGNQTRAAEILGISQGFISKLILKYGIHY